MVIQGRHQFVEGRIRSGGSGPTHIRSAVARFLRGAPAAVREAMVRSAAEENIILAPTPFRGWVFATGLHDTQTKGDENAIGNRVDANGWHEGDNHAGIRRRALR